MKLETIYSQLPISLQNIIISLYGHSLYRRRYGSNWKQIYKQTLGREHITTNELEKLHQAQSQALLKHASKIKYWNYLFEKYSINLASKDPLSEIYKLPISSKHDMQIVSRLKKIKTSYPSNTIQAHTSGSTGAGLVFPITPEAEKRQWAIWWRYRKRFGINPNTWCAYFGGKSVVSIKQKKPPFWRVNKPAKQILFSAYHLSATSAKDYLHEITKRRLTWIHGYPSMIHTLALYSLQLNFQLPNVKIVTIGSESLLAHQKETIEKAFNCPIRQHYGLAEGVVNISECEKGSLHIDEDFSLVELIPIPTCPDMYRIIGTNLTNMAFPFFRYDTGDIATISDLNQKCACGRRSRVVDDIDGRIEDMIELPCGSKISRLGHIFRELINIREAQIIQSKIGDLTFKIVKGEHFSSKDEIALIKVAHMRLGKKLNIKIKYEDHLPKTATGKLRFVIKE